MKMSKVVYRLILFTSLCLSALATPAGQCKEVVNRTGAALLQRQTESQRALITRRGSCQYCFCSVTSAAQCGVDTVTDAGKCGSKIITDGAKCGWDIFKSCSSRRRRRWKAKFKVKCEFGKTAKTCSVPTTCDVAKTCNLKSSFGECFGELASSLNSAGKGYAKLVTDSGCDSISSCKSKLQSGLSSALDSAMEHIKDSAENKAGTMVGEYRKAKVNKLYTQAQSLALQVKDAAVQMSSQIASLLSSLPNYLKYELGDVCSPADSGFWYMEPTDCGLFDTMSSISASNAVSLFDTAKVKLTECVTLTGLLGVPTPFWRLKFEGWCLPDEVVTAMEYFLGAIVYDDLDVTDVAFDGVKAAIRTAVKTISNVIKNFASSSGIGFLQLEGRQQHMASAGLGNALTDCGLNSDWGLELTTAFELTLVVGGATSTFHVGLGRLFGCRGNSAVFPNLVLRVGQAVGATTSAVGASKSILQQIHFYETYPAFTNRYAFGANLELTLEVDLKEIIGAPAGAGVPIVFGIYPNPAVPSQFSFQVAVEVGDDLVQLGSGLRSAAWHASRQADEAGGNGFIAGLAAATEHLGRHSAHLQQHLEQQAASSHVQGLSQHLLEPAKRQALAQAAMQHVGQQTPVEFTAEAAAAFTFCITPLKCFGQD